MAQILGCDYSSHPAGRPSVAALKAEGIQFAVRYVSYSSWKNMTKAEADRLRNGGIAVVTNWETSTGAMRNGYNLGVKSAQEANRQHLALGGDPHAPIYFSHDEDPAAGMSGVMEFLDGCAAVIGRSRVGLYGGYKAIQMAADGDRARWFWQTLAWMYGRGWHPKVHIRQTGFNWIVDGTNLDKNWAQFPNYGQWYARVPDVADVAEARDEIIVISEPEPEPSQEDELMLSILQCSDADAAFLAYTVKGVAAQVEWADRDTYDRFSTAGVGVQTVSRAQLRGCTLLGPLPAEDTKHDWQPEDFRRHVA